MEAAARSTSPNSWDSGPPESKSEAWNHERRSELLNVSQGILQAQIMGAMRNREDWQGDDGELGGVDPDKAVNLAKRLINAVENVYPKR
jgi:hypothetical protein